VDANTKTRATCWSASTNANITGKEEQENDPTDQKLNV